MVLLNADSYCTVSELLTHIIKPHRMHIKCGLLLPMLPMSVVCLFVCVLVTAALQKRTNRSKCRLGVDSLGLSNYMHVLDGGPDPQARDTSRRHTWAYSTLTARGQHVALRPDAAINIAICSYTYRSPCIHECITELY